MENTKTTAIEKVIETARKISEENGEHKLAFKMLCLFLDFVELKASLEEKEHFYQLLGSLPERMTEGKKISEVLEKEK